MRRLLLRRGLGIALGAGLLAGGVAISLHGRPLATKQDPHTSSSSDLYMPYGYNVFLKNAKHFKYFDRRKLRCNLKTREQHMGDLADEDNLFDVLVIGGGYTGAGVIYEAEMRGLMCALVDKGDFAGADSGKSSRLLHGQYFKESPTLVSGPVDRWLAMGAALEERSYLLNAAPYMIRPAELVLPCGNIFSAVYRYAGLMLYHVRYFLQSRSSGCTTFLPRPRLLSKVEMNLLFPSLKGDSYGVQFSELRTDDSRLVLQTLLTASLESYIACAKGAALGNYIEFVDFVKDGKGKCVGAKLRDNLNEGKEFTIRAKCIVNCAGAAADDIRMKDDPKAIRILGETTKSSYAVIPQAVYTKGGAGLILMDKARNQNTFLIPYKGDRAVLGCNPGSERDTLDTAVRHFSGLDLSKCRTASWTRETARPGATVPHVEISDSGLITVLGSHPTLYRKTGESVMQAIVKRFPEIDPVYRVSMAKRSRLMGAYSSKTFDGTEKTVSEFIHPYEQILNERYGLDRDICSQMVETYGIHAVQVAEMGKELGMNKRLHKDLPYLESQVVYAVRKEMAAKVDDVVSRRLEIGLTERKIAGEVIAKVASIMADELGWGYGQKKIEIEAAKKALAEL